MSLPRVSREPNTGGGKTSRTWLDCSRGTCEAAASGRGEPEGVDPGALLRSRVRVRDHAGLPTPARAPDVGRRPAVPDSAPRGVLVVELHDLDHQRTGYGDRPGLHVAAVVDARKPPHVCSDTAGFRDARAAVRRLIRCDTGGKALLPDFRGRRQRDGRTRAGRKHPHLVRGGGRAVDSRGPIRRSGTRRALAGCARARLWRAARDVLDTWPAAPPA